MTEQRLADMTKRHDVAKPDTDRPPVEITDEMIEAGASALMRIPRALGDGCSETPEEMVSKVLLAISRSSPKGPIFLLPED